MPAREAPGVPGVPTNGGTVLYRLYELERRVEHLFALEPAVLAREVKILGEDVKALKRAFYTFAFGVVGSAVVFAFTVFALLGHH